MLGSDAFLFASTSYVFEVGLDSSRFVPPSSAEVSSIVSSHFFDGIDSCFQGSELFFNLPISSLIFRFHLRECF